MAQMTKTVCGPVLGIALIREGQGRAWSRDCIAFNDTVVDWLRANRNIRHVVLGSPFELYFEDGARIQTRTGIEDGTSKVALRAFLATLLELKSIGVNPIVVAPPPFNGDNIGLCLARAEMFGFGHSRCDINARDYVKRHAELLRFLAEVSERYRVIPVSDLLCDMDTCRAAVDGIFIYRDARHYSTEGAEYVGKKLDLYQQITTD
jgi:hypothetical protein